MTTWEDPCDLVYAEYVDRYNFDALQGFELKVFERSKPVDVPVYTVYTTGVNSSVY